VGKGHKVLPGEAPRPTCCRLRKRGGSWTHHFRKKLGSRSNGAPPPRGPRARLCSKAVCATPASSRAALVETQHVTRLCVKRDANFAQRSAWLRQARSTRLRWKRKIRGGRARSRIAGARAEVRCRRRAEHVGGRFEAVGCVDIQTAARALTVMSQRSSRGPWSRIERPRRLPRRGPRGSPGEKRRIGIAVGVRVVRDSSKQGVGLLEVSSSSAQSASRESAPGSSR